MKNYEMANADNPEEIVMATQRSIISAMVEMIVELEQDPEVKSPGMTWEQIRYFLTAFGEKKPHIVFQRGAM